METFHSCEGVRVNFNCYVHLERASIYSAYTKQTFQIAVRQPCFAGGEQ